MTLRGRLKSASGTFVVLALLAASATFAQYSGSTAPPRDFKAGFDSIKVEDCKKWLGYLAGPECEGRGTGQPGFQKAAEYMADQFKQMGMRPAGDNGTYFQNLTFYRSRVESSATYMSVNGVKTPMPNRFAISGGGNSVEGEVIVLTTQSKEPKLDDTSVVKDMIVIVGSPVPDTFRRQLTRSGALAVFTLVDGTVPAPTWAVRRSKENRGGRGSALTGVISKDTVDRLSTQLEMRVNGSPTTSENAVTVSKASKRMEIVVKLTDEEVQVPNVVAVLPGTDPKLKNEVVGLGSHLDHLGIQGNVVYPGADDDASGSTALLAVAKAFSVNKVKPKRSIVFMAFCGEEMGLIGSGHYANNPLFPMENWVCELQMDMVGRNEEHGGANPEPAKDNVQTIHLVGSKRISTDLHELILSMNKHVGFTFEYDEEDVYSRSDHAMFAAKGVPIAFVFSGFHPDYHQPTDTIEKINFDKVANTAKLFYLTAATAANAPEKLKREVRTPPSGKG